MATKVNTILRPSVTGEWTGAPSVDDVEANVQAMVSIDDTDSPYDMSVNETVILADATGGAITVNLPPAASAAGKIITVKKTGTGINAVTLDPDGAEQINGAGTFANLDAAGDVVEVACDGSGWVTLNSTIA